MGLLARWLSVPLLGPLGVETWPRTEDSKEERRRPLNRARLDEIGGRRRYDPREADRLMELGDFAIGEIDETPD